MTTQTDAQHDVLVSRDATGLGGHWVSRDRIAPGSWGPRDYYADIVIDDSGSFSGIWRAYGCVSVGVVTDCRVTKDVPPEAISGFIDVETASGLVEGDGIPRSAITVRAVEGNGIEMEFAGAGAPTNSQQHPYRTTVYPAS